MKVIIKHSIHILSVFVAAVLLLTSCTKKTELTPTVNKIYPERGAGNEVITLTGSDIKNIQSITFDLGNVNAPFNLNFNTNGALIFRVPTSANVGPQNIVFTTLSGYQFSVPFTVLAVPSLISVSPAEWEAGSEITIKGNYLKTVTSAVLTASGEAAEIVSTTDNAVVLKMPASSAKSTKLTLTNDAGSSVSDFSINNMDQARKIFTDDYAAGIQNWSWCTTAISADVKLAGEKSLKADYAQGGWQGLSFHTDEVVTLTDMQALVFWVKGGSLDTKINVSPDAITSGSGSTKTIDVPSDVWTRFVIPAAELGNAGCQRINFQMQGPDGTPQTVYVDNVYLLRN
ncbi:MAG: hypothetical protein RL172_1422 [Bacteroidota bacterium]|jgi:hypothetical protein